MTPEILLAVQNVGLGIASFVFLAVIVWYILRRDDKRYDSQLEREDARIERQDKREERDDKRLDAWQGIVQTQSTQIATLIQQLGSQSTQIANVTATMIEMLQIVGRIEEFEKQNTIGIIQIRAMLGDKRSPDTGELKRIMEDRR